MQRQLKYQAWDNNSHSMSPVVTLADLFLSPDHTSPEDKTFFHECLTFREFTGISDLKGVEIYEHDFVFAYEFVWEVVFYKGGFVAIRPGQIRGIGNIECEVIGNKFQHPRLKSTAYYLSQRKI